MNGAREFREAARPVGEAALVEAGFLQDEAGVWLGELSLSGSHSVEVRVSMPEGFPLEVPEVFVENPSFAGQIPNVGSDGKVCTEAQEGTLLDFDSPRALVLHALELVKKTLLEAISGSRESNFIEEFVAYWDPDCTVSAASLCRPAGPAREVVAFRHKAHLPGGARMLLADSVAEGRQLLRSLGVAKHKRDVRALLVPLASSLPPPKFGEMLTVGQVLEILDDTASEADRTTVAQFLSSSKPPYTIVITMPGVSAADRIVVAVALRKPSAQAIAAVNGFRPRMAPYERVLGQMQEEPVVRIAVERLDKEHLGPRGGAEASASSKSVALVGVGAIGSVLAGKLARMGIGRLILVDGDKMAPANVFRHALGFPQIGRNKAEAVGDDLRGRFPQLSVDAFACDLEHALKDDSDLLADADIAVFATGEHTFELFANRLLGDSVVRVHTWVEPLGIGGHALACGFAGESGCLRCLYRDSDEWGMRNLASMLAPGQKTNRTVSGCAGTFTPFSSLAADQSALEAAKLVGALLREEVRTPVCVSWTGDLEVATNQGFGLSKRAHELGSNVLVSASDFVNSECTDCT